MGNLMTENSRLQSQYRVLSRKVDDALLVMHDIEERDDNLYRVMLEADPVPEVARQAGYNGTTDMPSLWTCLMRNLWLKPLKKWICWKKRYICRLVPLMR